MSTQNPRQGYVIRPWTNQSRLFNFIHTWHGKGAASFQNITERLGDFVRASKRKTRSPARKWLSLEHLEGRLAPAVSGHFQFSSYSYSVDEANAYATITVAYFPEIGDDSTVTVDFGAVNGSATELDYTPSQGTLTFTDAEATQTFNVLIDDDSSDEEDETVNLTLTNPVGGPTISNFCMLSTVLTIIDDDDVGNHAPVGTDKTVTTLEDSPFVFSSSDFGFTDPDDSPANDLLAVKITTLPSFGVITDNGEEVAVGDFVSVNDINSSWLVFTPAINCSGSPYDAFTFQVRDDGGTNNNGVDTDAVPRTLTILVTSVNDAPVAQDGGAFTDEDTPVTGTLPASDVETNDLAFSVVEGPSKGLLAGYSDGTFTFDPNAEFESLAAGQSEQVTILFTAYDEVGESSEIHVVTLTVNGANDAPEANDVCVSAAGDAVVTGSFDGWDVDIGDALSFVVVCSPVKGLVNNNLDGTFTFDPNGEFDIGGIEVVSFTYKVTDSASMDSVIRTVTITVNDNAPVAEDVYASTNEDAAVTASFDASDADAGDTLTYSIETAPSWGVATNNDNGTFTFDTNGQFATLANQDSECVTFSYFATDNHGVRSSIRSVTITVNGTNDAPDASDVEANTTGEIEVTACFAGSDVDSSDTLTYDLVTTPTKGVVTNNQDGTFKFDPNGEFQVGVCEAVTFNYRATDNHSAQSTVRTVTINVNDHAPEAEDVNTSTDEDSVVTTSFDATDEDSGDTMSFCITTAPSKGLVRNNEDGSFTFDPNGEFDGLEPGQVETVSFCYAAIDNHGAVSAVKTVVVAVQGAAVVLRTNITAYRPQTAIFRRTPVPEATEDTIGAGIRSNGDDDNRNNTPDWDPTDFGIVGENDLIELELDFGTQIQPAGVKYFLDRSNANVNVWTTRDKANTILMANDSGEIPFQGKKVSVWVEWVHPGFAAGDVVLTFGARDAIFQAVIGATDSVRVFRFTSVVIVFGGNLQTPTDPPNPIQGAFVIARELYANQAYDVHMFSQGGQSTVEATRGTGPAYDEAVNAVNNRRVHEISVIGYSWGGGATYNLVARLVADAAVGRIQNPFSIPFTAYIDAIQHGLAVAETRRPPASQFHVNYYERIGTPEAFLNIRGAAVAGADFELNVNTTPWGRAIDHYFIDDDLGGADNEALGVAGRRVLDGIRTSFLKKVNR